MLYRYNIDTVSLQYRYSVATVSIQYRNNIDIYIYVYIYLYIYPVLRWAAGSPNPAPPAGEFRALPCQNSCCVWLSIFLAVQTQFCVQISFHFTTLRVYKWGFCVLGYDVLVNTIFELLRPLAADPVTANLLRVTMLWFVAHLHDMPRIFSFHHHRC